MSEGVGRSKLLLRWWWRSEPSCRRCRLEGVWCWHPTKSSSSLRLTESSRLKSSRRRRSTKRLRWLLSLCRWSKRCLLHSLLHRHGLVSKTGRCTASWSRLLLSHGGHIGRRKPSLCSVIRSPPPCSRLIGLCLDGGSFWKGKLRLSGISLKGMLG